MVKVKDNKQYFSSIAFSWPHQNPAETIFLQVNLVGLPYFLVFLKGNNYIFIFFSYLSLMFCLSSQLGPNTPIAPAVLVPYCHAEFHLNYWSPA